MRAAVSAWAPTPGAALAGACMSGRAQAPGAMSPRRARPAGLGRAGLAEVAAEDLGAAGVAELGQGLGLDLADPLPGDAELPAHFLQRARVPVGQPEPQLDDLLLAPGEAVQDLLQLVLQHDERGGR